MYIHICTMYTLVNIYKMYISEFMERKPYLMQ